MQSNFVMQSLRRGQLDVFRSQARIASGRSFLSPSENPVAAAETLNLTEALALQQQFVANARHGDNTLAAADSALTEINSLLVEAASIASQNVSNLTSEAERESVAEVIAGIRQQLQIVGNRTFNGRFLFGGRATTSQPFIESPAGIAYVGDTGDLVTRVAEALSPAINVPGSELFRALSAPIATDVNLSPALSLDTRLDDLNGASRGGVRLGTLVFNEPTGAGVFRVDLQGADTIGNVADAINAAAASAGSTLSASISDVGLVITPGGSDITITDTSTGVIARDLGILTAIPTSTDIEGKDLGARVARLTQVDALARGAGIDLDGGLIVTVNGQSTEIDLSTATTVQDIINRINTSGVFLLARIKDDGSGIDVFNQVSGATLSIAENGGTTAADLGIRTFDTSTPLSRLNSDVGVISRDGENDLRVIAQDGSTVDVNLDGAQTIGDVIDLINQAATDATVGVEATLAEVGNGIRILDTTGGAGLLQVTGINLSQAATDLGLTDPASVTDGELVGQDQNPTRTQGILDALLDLETSLRKDDTRGITRAASRLDPFIQDVTRIHGIIGARAQAMQAKVSQVGDAAITTEIFLSEVKDLDFASAITEMQGALTSLQASLQTSSTLLNLSLMDFLR